MSKKILALRQPAPPGTWVQIERSGHQAWAKLTAEAPRAAQLLHILVAHMDKSGALVASHATLAKLMDTSTATTKRALTVLVEQAWIQTIRLGGERGGVLAYVVNCRVAWADARENMRYARFNARVLVSSEDEDDLGSGDLQRMPAIDTQSPQPSPEDDEPDMPITPESLPA